MIERDRQHFSEIRAFTNEELAWIQETLDNVDAIVAQRVRDLGKATLNPLNYVLETNRDAMTRLENLVKKDAADRDQLHNSRDAVVESGDTDKLQAWMDLAATINDSGAGRVFAEQAQYSSIAETVEHVAKDTISDLADPFKWPWWLWAIGVGAVAVKVIPAFIKKEK